MWFFPGVFVVSTPKNYYNLFLFLICQTLIRKRKVRTFGSVFWGLMFFSWWPCFIQIDVYPQWSIAELSQAVRVRGKIFNSLSISVCLSHIHTYRKMEGTASTGDKKWFPSATIILYILADTYTQYQEEKSSLRNYTEINISVTAFFTTSSAAEESNSIWSSFRINR